MSNVFALDTRVYYRTPAGGLEHSDLSNLFTLDTTDAALAIAITELSVNHSSLIRMLTVGESVTISGKLVKDEKGFQTTLTVQDSISQKSRSMQTDANGRFSFTTQPVPLPGSYLIRFFVDGKEIDTLNLVAPAGLYQPVFVIDDPNIKLTVGQNGAPLSESNITAVYSWKVASEPDRTGLESRITAGRIFSTGFQKWVEENVTPVSIAYWVVTGIVCLAPEPVITKGACGVMAMIGVGAAKVGTVKAGLKTVNELAVKDPSLKRNIDTTIDIGSLVHGIHDLTHAGTALEGAAEFIGEAGDFASALNKDNITQATLLDVSMSDGNVTGYRMEVTTKDNQVIEIVAAKPKPGIVIAGKSPIDLLVTAPNGARFGKSVQEIEGAKYYELDIDLDGDRDDLVMLPTPPSGEYSVEVIPEPGAALTDTYSLEVLSGDRVTVLVKEQMLQEATQPIKLEVNTTETGEITIEPISIQAMPWDVNGDGVVNIFDLVLVGGAFGTSGKGPPADVSGDGVVNIFDLVTVAAHFGETTNQTPPAAPQVPGSQYADRIEGWLTEARTVDDGSALFRRGIAVLESLLNAIVPEKTALLQNYPNPFNPETWIPYQLNQASKVEITIYDALGRVIKQLDLGYQPAGLYRTRPRAAHWDGRNEVGESVASGVYFVVLKTKGYQQARRIVLLK